MTPDEIAQLEALAALHAAATAAPWFAVVNDLMGGTAIANRDAPCSELDTRRSSTDREIGDFMQGADAALIVAARNAVPLVARLLTEWKAQREDIAAAHLLLREAVAHHLNPRSYTANQFRLTIEARLAASTPSEDPT